jgi:KaiC/GvpD/RAD55 family RecA-like ATPase
MPLYKNGILFELGKMAFAVEIALAVARKDTSTIQIKNKQDLYQVLTNREMFDMVLEQGLDYVLSDKETFDDTSRFEQLQKDNRSKIVNYFMTIKDKIKLEELRFY